MNMKTLVRIGFLYLLKLTKLFIVIYSFGIEHIPEEINTFIGNKKLKQVYLEYKRTIQLCADTFV